MTDRYGGFVVTLVHPIREDDAKSVMLALSMISGVAGVTPVVDDFEAEMARSAVRASVKRKLYEAIDAVLP